MNKSAEIALGRYFTNPSHDKAWREWGYVAAQAERLGYADHARDLAPHANATTRSIRVRTGKLLRFIEAIQ